MFLVIKHIDGITGDCGIDADGTIQKNMDQAELFATRGEAETVARLHGGKVVRESAVFAYDDSYDDE